MIGSLIKVKINGLGESFPTDPPPVPREVCAKIIDYGLLALLVFSPLPAASVREWSILVIELSVLAMMAAYVVMRRKPLISESQELAVRWPKYLFLGFFLVLLVQIIPLPKALVGILSPSAYSYLRQYAVHFSEMKFMSFSLIPSFTVQKGLELLSYFLLGFLVFKTVSRRHQILRLFVVLVAVGAFEAFFGLIELASKKPSLLFYRKIHNLDSVTGTFVNRNHLSGYLEMIVPLAIGLIISRIDLFSLRGLSWRQKIARFSERALAANLLLSFSVILMSLAIIFSKSRSGVFVLVLTFILFLGFTALDLEIRGPRKKAITNYLQGAFLVILMISLYVGIDRTLQRFAYDSLLQGGRPTYWGKTIRTCAQYPLLGTGLGTFGALTPPMGSSEGPLVLAHAHNDYLEYFSETGMMGFAFLLGGIVILITVSFLVWRRRQNPEIKGLALGGIISLLAILVHSLTDFNLHIPANMVLFSVVLSLTVVVAFHRWSRSEENT